MMIKFGVTLLCLINSYTGFASKLGAFNVGSLGDSITAGFNAKGPLDHRDLSWSAGQNINSHVVRLKNKLNMDINVKNSSKSGAKIAEIPNQVRNLLSNDFKPDYVTILIGANDICGGQKNPEELAAFGKKIFEDTLDSLTAVNPNVKVTIAAVPSISYLNEVLKNDAKCVKRWKALKICSAFMGDNPVEKANGQARWDAFNNMAKQVSLDHPEHVKFASRSGENIFKSEHVSRIDCFHPSLEGQKILAEETWSESWFTEDSFIAQILSDKF
jgi:lysophospholipase L1-like esterase